MFGVHKEDFGIRMFYRSLGSGVGVATLVRLMQLRLSPVETWAAALGGGGS
jgi:hypothetical protein